jgi:hypothetical protein
MNKIKFYRDSHSISRDMYEHINAPSLLEQDSNFFGKE